MIKIFSITFVWLNVSDCMGGTKRYRIGGAILPVFEKFNKLLTPQQRLQIVQLYYGNERSVRNVFDEAHFDVMRLISGSTATSINKIVAFGLKSNQKSCTSYHYTQIKPRFGAVYGLVESSVRNSWWPERNREWCSLSRHNIGLFAT